MRTMRVNDKNQKKFQNSTAEEVKDTETAEKVKSSEKADEPAAETDLNRFDKGLESDKKEYIQKRAKADSSEKMMKGNSTEKSNLGRYGDDGAVQFEHDFQKMCWCVQFT
ncbi:hypothetical protein L5515_010390 [Caenorhabditis briggsae]|uniref:Uncharacterized protein n=1 Tax=Caenorhabditis briggsae TaxID=6238 RepID=A0AAE9ETG9_CAEBR|nr:hypothetical protein L5515_010390 [Caenorhabditis briggsae]